MKFINKTASFILLATSIWMFAACSKTDEYADWKRMNDEWLDANNARSESFPFNWTVDILKNELVSESFETTESGIKFKPIRLGNPTDKKVNTTSLVLATYEGKLIDGTSFDSATETTFDMSNSTGTISGFREILLKMHIGDIYEFYLPAASAYGSESRGKIPPHSVLTFRVQLVDAIE